MNKSLVAFLSFVAGCAVGGFCVNWYLKDTYKQQADEEIASVKEVYAKMAEEKLNKSSEEIVKHFGYDTSKKDSILNYVKEKEAEMAEKESPNERQLPYRITDDMYADPDPYFEKVSCTYYVARDEVIEDISNEPIEIDTIGDQNLSIFRGSDEDLMYIRNEELGIDYEIARNDYDE